MQNIETDLISEAPQPMNLFEECRITKNAKYGNCPCLAAMPFTIFGPVWMASLIPKPENEIRKTMVKFCILIDILRPAY